MTDRTVVILGGGTGGRVAARRLRRSLDTTDRVMLVDRTPTFRFAPSFLWVLNGTRRAANTECDPDRVAEVLAAPASPSRSEIVRLLADGERDVTDIANRLSLSVANASLHLCRLRRAGGPAPFPASGASAPRWRPSASSPPREALSRSSSSTNRTPMDDTLPAFDSVLVVCAHPDDESFGLGALLSNLADAGSRITVLCYTHGEASALHAVPGDLARIRAAEMHAAGEVLGVTQIELLGYPDGNLDAVPVDDLAAHVTRLATEVAPSVLFVFDHGGITGHADHQRATDAALHASTTLDLQVLAWAIPTTVAEVLNGELGTSFVGRADDEVDIAVTVNRARQLDAIRQHRSQSTDNPVLWRRLELLGATEHLRYLN